MKAFILKISLLIFSPILFLGITEAAFRQFGGDRVENHYVKQTETALGEPVPAKKTGEYRAFLFGGSSAYGFPVTDRSSVTAWLNQSFEKLLPGAKVRVINCAWPGKASHHDLEGVLTALQFSPDLFIVYTGHNEANVLNRIYADSPIYRLTLKLSFRSAFYMWLTSRLERLQKFLSRGRAKPQARDEVISQILYQSAEVTDSEYANIALHFKRNMEAILRAARKRGVPVLFVTPAANLRDAAPRGSAHRPDLSEVEREAWNRLYEKGKALYGEGDFSGAAKAFREAAAIDGEYAALRYDLARALEKAGDFENARREYRAARDKDAIPTRAKSVLIEILKDFENPPEIMTVDLEEIYESASPHGLIGYELMYDDVHPTVKGQQVIAEAVLRVLRENHWPKPAAEWNWEAFEQLRGSELWSVDATHDAYRDVLSALMLWQQKNYKDAAAAFEKGLTAMPGFIEAHAFLADSYFRTGNPEKAASAFRALQQKDPVLEEKLREKYPDLQEAYSQIRNLLPASA